MANVLETLQQIASSTRHVAELQKRIDTIDHYMRQLDERTSERIHAIAVDVAALSFASWMKSST